MNTVKILGLTYRIERVPVVSRDEKLFGMINYEDLVISIDEALSPERQKVTILHEIIHGILEALGLSPENENETLVQGLTSALYQCFLDNRDLF